MKKLLHTLGMSVFVIPIIFISCSKSGNTNTPPVVVPPTPDTTLRVTVSSGQTLAYGQKGSIVYSTENATSVVIVPGEGAQPLFGTYWTTNLFVTTTYTVTAYKGNLSASKTVTFIVTPLDPKTALFVASPWFNDSIYTQQITPTPGSLIGVQTTGCTRTSTWVFRYDGTFTNNDHCSGNTFTGVWTWKSNQDSVVIGGESWGVKGLTTDYKALEKVENTVPTGTGLKRKTYKH